MGFNDRFIIYSFFEKHYTVWKRQWFFEKVTNMVKKDTIFFEKDTKLSRKLHLYGWNTIIQLKKRRFKYGFVVKCSYEFKINCIQHIMFHGFVMVQDKSATFLISNLNTIN